MVATLKTRSTARRNAKAAFQFWQSWFVVTSAAILGMLSFSNFQDAGPELLMETRDTRELSSVDDEYLTQQFENNNNNNKPKEKKKKEPEDEVYFLNGTNLAHHDGFSASWLQTREDFMTMPFDDIHSCEHAAFRSYDMKRLPKYRMTLDWMQFSVEHMSKWWKLLEWDENEIAYQKLVTNFRKYLEGAQQFPLDEERVFQNTIAVIAFQSYRSLTQPEQAHNLTSLSLAATVESLRRAGFGRVVTSILVPQDIPYVEDAYRSAAAQFDKSSNSQTAINKVGHMEVGYAYASKAYTRTNYLIKNMPRATIMTLRDAFLHSLQSESERTDDMKQNITLWLGDTQDPSYWKYVYLTEPDSILQIRPSALPGIKAEIDKGNVMLPHRWQPIPHESDVRGLNKTELFLMEDEFPGVLDLDPIHNHDACCDENKGKGFKPGMPPFYDWCGKRLFWYSCGFVPKNRKEEDKHRRLKPYKLIRLLGGTEITTIAGSEHARRCHPKTNGVCRPNDVNPSDDFVKRFDEEKRKYVESMLHTIQK